MDYTVNYQINVNSTPALESIRKFQEATQQMEALTKRFDVVSKSIGKVNSAFASLNRNHVKMDVDTTRVEQKLTRVLALLNEVKVAGNAISQGKIQKVMSAPMAGVYNGKNASTSFTGNKVNTRAAQSDLTNLMKKISDTQQSINNINKRYINPKARTKTAMESLDKLIAKIEQVKSMSNITITASGPRQGKSQTSTGASAAAAGAAGAASATGQAASRTTSRRTSSGTPVNRSLFPSVRQVLGPTYATTGTNVAAEMVKGMGVAYGLSSLMSGVTKVFHDATTYDNISQTTKNILGTHDTSANFDEKFAKANDIMRQVGVETKFTAPQVASAGKFLAMAGMKVEDIQQAISPIANLAIVGDTDLGSTADMTTNIMTSYEIPAKRMSNAADVLTMTFTKTNTTLWDLAESFKYAGTVAHQSGMSFENASAALGVLGDAGIQGSHAGTTLRMMLLNMMNPTKKGKAAWKALGINVKDENGNMRDFNTILSELNEKRKTLSAGDFQSLINNMFRVTAAPGALALIQNADKVKQVTDLNRDKSIGLSENLADEKKNTIQGLWYQMTSAFTESGMQGFEQMQDAIRDFLQRMIALMKSPEFAQGLKDMMDLFLKTMDSMVSMFKLIMSVWNALPNWSKNFIADWIKWSMWLSLGASSLKSIWSTLIMIKAVFKGQLLFNVANFTASILHLGSAVKYFFTAAKGGGILAGLASVRHGFGLASRIGAARAVGGTVATGAMMAGRYSNLQSIGSVSIASLLGKAGMFLLTNPWMWAVGGIGLLATEIIRTITHTKEAKAITEEWAASYRQFGVDKMNLASTDDLFIGNMRIASNSLLNEQEKLQASIDLYNRYWEAKNGPKKEENKDTTPFAETKEGSNYAKLLTKADDWWSKDEAFRPIAEQLLGKNWRKNLKFDDVSNRFMANFNGVNIPMRKSSQEAIWADYRNGISEEGAVQLILAQMGSNPNHENIKKLEQYLMKNVDKTYGMADRQVFLNKAKDMYFPRLYTHTLDPGVSSETAQDASLYDIEHSLAFVRAQQLIVKQILEQYKDLGYIEQDFDKGKQLDPAAVQRVLNNRFSILFDPKFGLFGTPEWIQNITNELHNTKKYGDINRVTELINGTFTSLATWFADLPARYQPIFAGFLNRGYWEQIMSGATNGNGLLGAGGVKNGTREGETMYIGGKMYTWQLRDGKPYYSWYDVTGKQYVPKNTKETVTPTTTKRWTPRTNKALNRIHTGADESKYKNHYSNNAAAPKQVIVRIGNLMNVDKIDLTNEHKAAAVATLKQDLAAALLDVVQDFNENVIG